MFIPPRHNPYREPVGGDRPIRQIKGKLSEINTGASEFYVKEYLNGTIEFKYHDNLVDLLDRVFIQDAPKYLNVEQKRFIQLFLYEADIAMGNEKENKDFYKDMHKEYIDLDHFLGSYGL